MCRFSVSAEVLSCCLLDRQSWRFDCIGHLITRHWGQSNSQVELLKPEIFLELALHNSIGKFSLVLSSLCPHRSSFLSSLSRLSLSFLLRDKAPAPAPLSILLPLAGSRRPESQSQSARRDGGRGAWASASASGPSSEVARSVVGGGAAARWRPLWLSRRKEQPTDVTDDAQLLHQLC